MGTVVAAVLLLLGIILAIRAFPAQTDLTLANYLLAVVAAAGTLAGIGFAVYGWYQSRIMPGVVKKEIARQFEEWTKEQRKKAYQQQQAIQKVMASYQVKDLERRLALLQQAVEADPDVYNGYVAIGYAYLEKGDLETAEQMFETEYEKHDSYQAACDIAYVYILRGEKRAAVRWLQKAVTLNSEARAGIREDARFGCLEQEFPKEYARIVQPV